MTGRILYEAFQLGPEPPWWRPIKRRRWRRAMRGLSALWVAMLVTGVRHEDELSGEAVN